jgi:hypothetical protein
MWSLSGIPALVLKDFNRSPGIVSLLVDSIWTSCGVHMELSGIHSCRHLERGPDGLQVDS